MAAPQPRFWSGRSARSASDEDWLALFTQRFPETIGYAIGFLPASARSTLAVSQVVKGRVHVRWLYLGPTSGARYG